MIYQLISTANSAQFHSKISPSQGVEYIRDIRNIRSSKRSEANTEIQSSNILRSNIRTYLEGHGIFRYHFLYSKIRRLEDSTSHLYTVKDITEMCFCFIIELIH